MPGLEVLLKMQGNLEHMWSVFRKPGVSIEIFKPFFADNIQPCPLPSAPEKSTPGHSSQSRRKPESPRPFFQRLLPSTEW